jgi:hypothetical protein
MAPSSTLSSSSQGSLFNSLARKGQSVSSQSTPSP